MGHFWGARLFVASVSQAGVAGLSNSVRAYEWNRMWISGVVTHSFWFSRYMEGLRKRVGENRRQDVPITIDVLCTLEKIIEHEWSKSDRP